MGEPAQQKSVGSEKREGRKPGKGGIQKTRHTGWSPGSLAQGALGREVADWTRTERQRECLLPPSHSLVKGSQGARGVPWAIAGSSRLSSGGGVPQGGGAGRGVRAQWSAREGRGREGCTRGLTARARGPGQSCFQCPHRVSVLQLGLGWVGVDGAAVPWSEESWPPVTWRSCYDHPHLQVRKQAQMVVSSSKSAK